MAEVNLGDGCILLFSVLPLNTTYLYELLMCEKHFVDRMVYIDFLNHGLLHNLL